MHVCQIVQQHSPWLRENSHLLLCVLAAMSEWLLTLIPHLFQYLQAGMVIRGSKHWSKHCSKHSSKHSSSSSGKYKHLIIQSPLLTLTISLDCWMYRVSWQWGKCNEKSLDEPNHWWFSQTHYCLYLAGVAKDASELEYDYNIGNWITPCKYGTIVLCLNIKHLNTLFA